MRKIALPLLAVLFALTGQVSSAPLPTDATAKVSPKEFAEVVRQAKTAVIAFEDYRDQRKSKDAVVEDRAWIEKLAALIESGPLAPKAHCLCISTPSLELYGADGRLLKLTLHHESKLRSSGLINGDFDLGIARAGAIRALIDAQEPAARERVAPRGNGSTSRK